MAKCNVLVKNGKRIQVGAQDEVFVGLDVHTKHVNVAVRLNGRQVARWMSPPGSATVAKSLRPLGAAGPRRQRPLPTSAGQHRLRAEGHRGGGAADKREPMAHAPARGAIPPRGIIGPGRRPGNGKRRRQGGKAGTASGHGDRERARDAGEGIGEDHVVIL